MGFIELDYFFEKEKLFWGWGQCKKPWLNPSYTENLWKILSWSSRWIFYQSLKILKLVVRLWSICHFSNSVNWDPKIFVFH